MASTGPIPADIIREIFLHLSSPLRLLEPHEFPWYLGQICSKWRAIFFSMQAYFWNEIEMERPEDKETRPWIRSYSPNDPKPELPRTLRPDSARTMAILAFFLDVAHGAPFSFTLYEKKSYYSDQEVSCVELVLSKLIDHSTQWENVSMQLRLPEFLLLRSVKSRLPLLQRLELILPYRHEMERANHDVTLLPQMGDIFEDAPLLTDIQLLHLEDAAWKFNWASLTSIHLRSSDSPQTIIATLQQTVNLEALNIGSTIFDPDLAHMNAKTIKLPCLECLCIEGAFLLTILETPALKKLEIEFEESDPNNARKTIDFLLRSNCELSVLSLKHLALRAHKEVLLHTPDLEELILAHDEFLVEVVKWLAGSTTDAAQPREPPLRNLNSLSLYSYSSINNRHLQAVQKMIKSRHSTVDTGIERLQELDIETNVMWVGSSSVLESLELLCEKEEVDFEFTSWDPKPPETLVFLPISAKVRRF
ncbi:hypothetical protein F5887DRAFT_1287177 [Amanita rubescens]|nr:hypothetical protein F5887DRAFT_1287177 [Amanita rubescens]